MSADRHAEIMAILHQMQAAAQPGEQVTNIRKVKSYIAHLSGRISELEDGPGVKLVNRRTESYCVCGAKVEAECFCGKAGLREPTR